MTKKATSERPEKPYPTFPLYAHPGGQWVKKIKGKVWYFGTWSDPVAALEKYQREREMIEQGMNPAFFEIDPGDITLKDMVNIYLTHMEKRSNAGEIGKRHFQDTVNSCKFMVNSLGATRPVSELKAVHFLALKESFPETWGNTKRGTEIQRMRQPFSWAYENEIIDALPRFGSGFRKVSKRVSRMDKRARQDRDGLLLFAPKDLRMCLRASSGWVRACILLGINLSMENSECGRFKVSHIDSDSLFYDIPRHKTGVTRQGFAWQETLDACLIGTNSLPDELAFRTSHGKPVWWETEKGVACDNVGKSFTKVLKKLGLYRRGIGFYTLRRTFETVAGGCKDQVAVDLCMGHTDDSMASVYRQTVEPERIQDVSDQVYAWLTEDGKYDI